MEIYKKLLSIQQSLKVTKSKENKFGGYQYRSAEQILEAVKPLLQEQGCVIFSSDEIRNVGESNYVITTVNFVDAETGDSLQVSATAREDIAAKGMSASQMSGSCSSYSKKYALQNLFAIDNNKDADDEGVSTNLMKAQIDSCKSPKELLNVWNNMTDSQRDALKTYFTQKKKTFNK